MEALRVKDGSQLNDIASWRNAEGDLSLGLSRQSSFALGVEGVAVTLLSELVSRVALHVSCTFDPIKDMDVQGSDAQLGILDTLFGLATIAAARTVTIGQSDENVRSVLLERVWRRLQGGRGTVGDGKHRAIVSRDPEEPLPEVLRSPEGTFPRREAFGDVLFQKASSIGTGARRRYSSSEQDAITFIYEAAKNSFEHGRHDTQGRPVRGMRGVIVEKLSFVSEEDLYRRRDISELQRCFFRHHWKDLQKQRVAAAYTVVDAGPGIHHTLPPLGRTEAPWERLHRAFQPKQSRKARGVDLESGMGLPKLSAAAQRLGALLLVKSAELSGHCDFSSGKTDPDNLRLEPSESEVGNRGTSLTLIWPLVAQPSLF